MVDARLYPPNAWSEDKFRCEEAGIPEESREFKMKWELAIDIIRHQQSLGINPDYIGGDGYYGNSIELAQAVEDMGYVYMFDIHSNLTIYLEKAKIGILPYNGKGRKPTKEKPLSESIRADKYMTGLSDEDWHRIEVRNTTKGKLTGDYHFTGFTFGMKRITGCYPVY